MQYGKFGRYLTPLMRKVLKALKDGQLFIRSSSSIIFVKGASVHHQTEGALLRRGFIELRSVEAYVLTEKGKQALLDQAYTE